MEKDPIERIERELSDVAPEKRKRGRRSKAEIQLEEQSAQKADMENALSELQPLALILIQSVGKIIDSFAPGCSWDKATMDQASVHLSRVIYRRLPNFEETDEAAVLILLGLPLLANYEEIIYAYKTKKEIATEKTERAIQEAQNGEEKTKVRG